MKKLFTECYGMAPARTGEELTSDAATALLGLVDARMDENWFGESFPFECQDGGRNAGCDTRKLETALNGYNVVWPKDWPAHSENVPSDPQIFDLLEFSYEQVALPEPYGFHSYHSHDHFNYDVEQGRQRFAADVNRLFRAPGPGV